MAVDSGWLLEQFQREFCGSAGDEVFVARAPGRVNLIGEHTDYSGGFVLPVAVGRDVAIAFRPRLDRTVSLYSCSYRQMTQFCLDDVRPSADAPWSNYFRGTVWALGDGEHEHEDEGEFRRGFAVAGRDGRSQLTGIDAVIAGDVPEGAGLSSSAAFEVASAIALLVAAGMDTDAINDSDSECGLEVRREIARVCQKAENCFVGVNCGIMDQMVSCMGRADHAVYLDCRSLEHELVGLGLQSAQAVLVVYDTGIRRGLVDSEYNRRREETEVGARMISGAVGHSGVETLRDVDVDTFEEIKGVLPTTVARRCEHVIRENQRVKDGAAALRNGDLSAFGDLMWQSHESLRDLYEVSCAELDEAVEIARKTDGVIGARMTGAGFGGCTVNLVYREALSDLIGALPSSPMRPGVLAPRPFIVDVVDGGKVEEPQRL